MQEELGILYLEYLKKESIYLDTEKKNLLAERNKISSELQSIADKISDAEEGNSLEGNKKIEELKIVEQKLNENRATKSEIERKLGRIEGMLEIKENKVKLGGICPLCGNELKQIEIEQIEKRQNEEKELQELIEEEERKLSEKIQVLKKEINEEMEALRDLEKEKFKFKVRHQELASSLTFVSIKESNLENRKHAFENEIKEGTALIGQGILSYKDFKIQSDDAEINQEELKRKIERLKIKLEDAGFGSGAEVMKEFKEVSERDAFLAKEMEDLTKSIESLVILINDLKTKIDIEFKEGVKKINVEFEDFFRLMFGGGTASLSIITETKKRREKVGPLESPRSDLEEPIDEEIVFEEGIEINVSLPQKKVKELHALSGGERSLTSIALLFAMSQVNPPPFLVLDETDAALDESNSRKYGDMLEKLSKHSQLVVVTHNRETMSRAGILYGVTIGANGASKLLSVKFDEAVSIAK